MSKPKANLKHLKTNTVLKRRSTKRKLGRHFNKETAARSIGNIEKGCEIFGFSKGQFSKIDIIEHWGHNPTKVSSATHTPSCSGGCGGTSVGETTVSDFDSEFHVYGLEWNENELRFFIDDSFLYAYNPAVKDSSTWPFDNPQFFILNIAMGGSWFTIDPNFTESTMEIDFIRVYQ